MSQRSKVQTILDSLTSLLTAAAAVVLMWNLTVSRTAAQNPQRQARTPTATVNGIETSIAASHRAHEGATLAIIEFSDFECPFCGRYARETYPRIQAELVDKGIVNYSFRNFPLESIHKSAFKAGEASACAGEQGKFWEMHDRLFQNQKQLSETDLLGYAKTIGLNAAHFSSCLTNQMAGTIKADQEEAKKFGINSTPTFLVGVIEQNGKVKVVRKLSGAQPFETFKSVLDEVRKGA